MLTLKERDAARSYAAPALCADIDAFSLYAAALAQLCRDITRPALTNERVQTDAANQVVLKLKTPWRDGTTHRVMSPLELMQRLAALVSRLRLHPPVTASRLSSRQCDTRLGS